jgi:uncharacterized repeat protein (TIGR03803 family)
MRLKMPIGERVTMAAGSLCRVFGLAVIACALWQDSAAAASVDVRMFPFPKDIVHPEFGDRPGPLTVGRDGYLYGTEAYGGPNGAGFVYQMTPAGSFRILHTFSGPDGLQPEGRLNFGHDGALYGTTRGAPRRTLFRVTTEGNFTTLYVFPRGEAVNFTVLAENDVGIVYPVQADPWANSPVSRDRLTALLDEISELKGKVYPRDVPTKGPDGRLYGLMQYPFGSPPVEERCVIYRMKDDGTFEIVYRFQGPGQVNVFSGPLVFAPDGFLYGVILDFEKPNSAVFRLDVRQ